MGSYCPACRSLLNWQAVLPRLCWGLSGVFVLGGCLALAGRAEALGSGFSPFVSYVGGAIAVGAFLGLAVCLWLRRGTQVEYAPTSPPESPEAAEEPIGRSPSHREFAHFVESRVQEILADFTEEQSGEERVTLAREMGVAFQPGEPLVYWDGHPVLCGGPVAQAQVCPERSDLVVLLTEDSCEARLEVYGRGGDKQATFAPPADFSFVELRLGYVPPFATKRVAAVVLCRGASSIDDARDWLFRIDPEGQRLERLQPIAGS